MAAPSFRNSGLETMSNSCFVSGDMTACSCAQVPTGTVLFVTTAVASMARASRGPRP
jgi:hypothetical protein